MTPWVARTLAHVDRMSQRERIVVTLCIGLVSWFVLDGYLIAPAHKELTILEQLIATQQETLAQTNAQLDALHSGRIPPGDPALRAHLTAIENEARAIDSDLRASQQYLVPPESMSALLQDLLRRDPRLQLVSLQTLPVTSILQNDQAADMEAASSATPSSPPQRKTSSASIETGMFRHGVRLVVRGEYLRVLDYLQEVEKLPSQMYWGRLVLDASSTKPPSFEFFIYTLSLDKSWLQI